MYDLYRYIEHVTHMCLRSWSVLYSDHLNLEIPVDIKKKKFCVSKAQDVHVVSVSLSVNGDSYWKAQLFDIIVCVTWSWHYFADDKDCDALFAFKFQSLYTLPKSKPTEHTCQKCCKEICTCMHVHLLSLNS